MKRIISTMMVVLLGSGCLFAGGSKEQAVEKKAPDSMALILSGPAND